MLQKHTLIKILFALLLVAAMINPAPAQAQSCDVELVMQIAEQAEAAGYASVKINLADCTVEFAFAPEAAAASGSADSDAPSEPAAAQPAATGPCRLEKDGTWSEGNNPYRIEVAGHGVRHNDFYPQVGVKSISYIVGQIMPPQVSPTWWGYGSQWSGDAPECQSFGWVKDASAYADGRLDSGHSGLVVDMRNGQSNVVYNATNMSQNEIDSLLAVHMAAMQGNQPSQLPASSSTMSSEEPAAAAETEDAASSEPSTVAAECISTRQGDADNKTIKVPTGSTYVVEAWSPTEGTMVFAEGKTISGWKGALWVYPCGLDATKADLDGQEKTYTVK